MLTATLRAMMTMTYSNERKAAHHWDGNVFTISNSFFFLSDNLMFKPDRYIQLNRVIIEFHFKVQTTMGRLFQDNKGKLDNQKGNNITSCPWYMKVP